MHPSTPLCLNAPYGARCFLTNYAQVRISVDGSLNAPYGARCFLTGDNYVSFGDYGGLNAPYGARCFLTDEARRCSSAKRSTVLMHLMALGAF